MALDSKAGEETFDDPLASSDDHDPTQHVLCPAHTTKSKLVASLDMRLVPILILLYLMSFLDRINISNAITLGLQKDLRLKGHQINTVLAVFYVPYILFEIPSNLLLKRFRPHVWLSICIMAVGLVEMCHGFVRSYGGLIATRLLLGVAESGVFPGCFYLLSMWYTREEALMRFTLFFNSVTLAGAFGSLLASAIENMNGIQGYSGWRWIFILEGLATIVVGASSFFVISDFPEDATWLREDERHFMQARLIEDEEDQGDVPLSVGLNKYFKDYKSYLAALLYLGGNVGGYSLSYFLPTIVRGFHYSTISTQLHSVPPFAAAFTFSLLISYMSTKAGHRVSFVVFPLLVGLTGAAILYNVHHNVRLEYGAVCLVAMGIFGSLSVALAWYNMNLRGHLNRAIGTAWMIGFGNIGGIIATFSFLSNDAPEYRTGYIVIISGLCLTMAASIAYAAGCHLENRRNARKAGFGGRPPKLTL